MSLSKLITDSFSDVNMLKKGQSANIKKQKQMTNTKNSQEMTSYENITCRHILHHLYHKLKTASAVPFACRKKRATDCTTYPPGLPATQPTNGSVQIPSPTGALRQCENPEMNCHICVRYWHQCLSE